jgi:hypothetical protein
MRRHVDSGRVVGICCGPADSDEHDQIRVRLRLDELVVVHIGAEAVDAFGVLTVTPSTRAFEELLSVRGATDVATAVTGRGCCVAAGVTVSAGRHHKGKDGEEHEPFRSLHRVTFRMSR